MKKDTSRMQRITGTAVLVIVLMSGMLASGTARASEPLTWEDCVAQAREHNPSLVAALNRIAEARAGKLISSSSFYPQISASGSGNTSSGGGGDESSSSYSLGISARQLIYDWKKTSYGVKSATASILAAEYNYMVTSSSVRVELRSAFVEVLKSRELVEITEGIAKRRQENVDEVTLRYKAGTENKGSLLTSEANLDQAKYEVKQAKRQLALSRKQLAKAMGLVAADDADVEVEGELVMKDYTDDEVEFRELALNTPYVKSLNIQEESASYDLESARAGYYPDIYGSASVGVNDTDWPPENDEWSMGVSVSVPIFNGGETKAQVSKARSALKIASAQTESGFNDTLLSIEQAWNDLRDAFESIAVQKRFLDAATERSKIAQVRYSNGLIGFDDWIIIEDELVSTTKAYLNARANALVAEAKWLEAQGRTLEEDMTRE